MIECAECAGEISSDAQICPTCGHKQFEFSRMYSFAATIMIFLALLWFLPSFSFKGVIVGLGCGGLYEVLKKIRT